MGERLTSAGAGGGNVMRLRGFLAGLVVVATAVSGGALAACPAFPPPQATAGGGQFGATVMGGMKPVPAPTRHLPIPVGAPSSVRIVLARSGCFGTCPAYSVDVHGDGTVLFQGQAYVLTPGAHSAHISPEVVQCLLQDFRTADFWSLAPRYAAPITDGAFHNVTLEIGGQRKTVIDYFGRAVGMPAAMTDLETAIDVAASNRFIDGDEHTMEALRAEHFDFRSSAGGALLAAAAATGPDDLVLDLIAAGAPVHDRPPQEPARAGEPAINAAAARGRARVVRALIAAGAFDGDDANLRNEAYLRAAKALDEDTLVEILAAHPDINARGPDGKTALMALEHDDENDADERARNNPRELSIARRLLAQGADVTLRDNAGDTALFYVTEPELARLLVKAGAPLETRNELGWTPLLTAGSDEAAVALLEAGADPRAVGDDGGTVLKNATERKWVRTLAFLAAHGVTR